MPKPGSPYCRRRSCLCSISRLLDRVLGQMHLARIQPLADEVPTPGQALNEVAGLQQACLAKLQRVGLQGGLGMNASQQEEMIRQMMSNPMTQAMFSNPEFMRVSMRSLLCWRAADGFLCWRPTARKQAWASLSAARWQACWRFKSSLQCATSLPNPGGPLFVLQAMLQSNPMIRQMTEVRLQSTT